MAAIVNQDFRYCIKTKRKDPTSFRHVELEPMRELGIRIMF